VVGDDDTLFSPLALAQYLQNFYAADPWYIGGRSETAEQRTHLGYLMLPPLQHTPPPSPSKACLLHRWDMAFGGGGIVLSGGFMEDYGLALEK